MAARLGRRIAGLRPWLPAALCSLPALTLVSLPPGHPLLLPLQGQPTCYLQVSGMVTADVLADDAEYDDVSMLRPLSTLCMLCTHCARCISCALAVRCSDQSAFAPGRQPCLLPPLLPILPPATAPPEQVLADIHGECNLHGTVLRVSAKHRQRPPSFVQGACTGC